MMFNFPSLRSIAKGSGKRLEQLQKIMKLYFLCVIKCRVILNLLKLSLPCICSPMPARKGRTRACLCVHTHSTSTRLPCHHLPPRVCTHNSINEKRRLHCRFQGEIANSLGNRFIIPLQYSALDLRCTFFKCEYWISLSQNLSYYHDVS